ncbi:MAG: EAL domain-containing protein [Candidatus Dormibacteraeota bacterium]|nr:EAL domain-containing protein [Candidatus Dormibacteraeota bacterium]
MLELNGRERIAARCRLATVLADYRRAGVRFALSNVASASRAARLLGALQPEFVKLDRTLTVTSREASSANAIEVSIALARACGATLIAEGLEDWDAIERMRALGIELGQGFSVGPPLRAGEVRDALEARIVAMRAGGCEDLPSDRHGSQLATLEERRSGVDPRAARRCTTHALLSWQARKNVEAVLTRLVRTRSAIEESRAAMRPRQVASDPERPREQ